MLSIVSRAFSKDDMVTETNGKDKTTRLKNKQMKSSKQQFAISESAANPTDGQCSSRQAGRPPCRGLGIAVSLLMGLIIPAHGEQTVVYVSESGQNRIAVFSLDENKGQLSRLGDVILEGAPGSLAPSADKKHLYVAVRSEKSFATLSIDPSTGLLTPVTTVPASGSAAYIHPDATGRWLLAAYYGEGLVSVSRISEEGIIEGEPLHVLDIGPKAHCIVTDPANRFAFCPHPMDLNCVDQFLFNAETGALTLNDPASMPGGEGNGPRHIKFHPNGLWAYLVNEQGKSVTFCHYDAEKGTLALKQTISTHPQDWDPNQGSCAEIKISSDGRFVYASNRGHDSLASFTVNQVTGELSELERIPTEKVPRSFDLMPGEKFVVSAGQEVGRLALYRLDVETGKLERLQTLDCGKSPAWVLGMRLP